MIKNDARVLSVWAGNVSAEEARAYLFDDIDDDVFSSQFAKDVNARYLDPDAIEMHSSECSVSVADLLRRHRLGGEMAAQLGSGGDRKCTVVVLVLAIAADDADTPVLWHVGNVPAPPGLARLAESLG